MMWSAASTPDLVATLGQYGVIGAVLLAVLMGYLVPRWAIQDRDKQLAEKEAEIVRLRGENQALQQGIMKETQPLLQQVTTVLSEVIRGMDKRS